MSKPSWRFKGNEKKYLEEVLSNGFRAGSDGSFNQRLEAMFSKKYRFKGKFAGGNTGPYYE